MRNLKEWVDYCQAHLSPLEGDVQLEANYLLSHITHKQPSQLLYTKETLTAAQQTQLNQYIKRRLTGEPLAYIIGWAEFYGLPIQVNSDVLVPRSDTECMVEWLIARLGFQFRGHILDLGTGSGAIALAIKHHLPHTRVTAIDQSEKAVKAAQHNAQCLGIALETKTNNWLSGYEESSIDIIISNPPYIEKHDPHLTMLKHEPLNALVAGIDGLNDIKIIIKQSHTCLKKNGLLVLEHGYNQAQKIQTLLSKLDFTAIESHKDLSGVDRFCSAIKP